MDRCQSCQNILPRTVDRCPVCGSTTAPAEEPVEETTAPNVTDFLQSIGGRARPTGQTPTVPTVASTRSKRTPTRVGHDGAAPLYDPDPEREKRSQRSSDFDLPDLDQGTRTVAAMSARLNSNIKPGRRPHHNAGIVAAAIISVVSISGGTAFGHLQTGEPERIAMTSAEVPIGAGAASLIVTGPVENFDPRVMVRIEEPDACGSPVDATGVVVDGGVVATSRFDAEQADAPQLSAGSVETIGEVLGISNTTDLSIIRATDRLEQRLRIAVGSQIRKGDAVALVQEDGQDIVLQPAMVTSLQVRSGELHSYSIQATSAGAADATGGFERGTVVLDHNGDLIGIFGSDGNVVTPERIASTVALFRAEPTFPGPRCP
jgi:hypothetical protein